MAKFLSELNRDLTEFIEQQKIFFVASAPHEGRVNLSPKGTDCLRVFDSQRVAYLDLTGSGNETAAHVGENGRMTMMFCGFEKRPLILRLYGRGEIVPKDSESWATMAKTFPQQRGARQIVVLHIDSVQSSCGFAVPFYDYVGERGALGRWAAAKSDEELEDYRRDKNSSSIDGLPTGIVP